MRGNHRSQYAINGYKAPGNFPMQEEAYRGAISAHGGHSNDSRPFVELNGDPVAEGDYFAGIGGDAIAGNNDADKIQRIGGRYGDDFSKWLLTAHGAQGFYGHRQSELLS